MSLIGDIASSDKEGRGVNDNSENKRGNTGNSGLINKRVGNIRGGIGEPSHGGSPQHPHDPRIDIKVVGNVQIAPPSRRTNLKKSKLDHSTNDFEYNRDDGVWKTVGKGGKKVFRESARISGNNVPYRPTQSTPGVKNKKKTSENVVVPVKRFTPKPAVVTITNSSGEFSYAKILSTARAKGFVEGHRNNEH